MQHHFTHELKLSSSALSKQLIMLFNKFFVFLGIFIGKPCLSENIIGRNQLNEFNELEEAAMKIIKNCCSIQEKTKTIALFGDIPGPFIKRLSSDQSFSTILLDYRRGADKRFKHSLKKSNMIEKVDVLIGIATNGFRVFNMIKSLGNSYDSSDTFVLILGWSPKNRYAGCVGNTQTYEMLYALDASQILNGIVICRNNPKGLKIFSFNGFTNYAPQPWQMVLSHKKYPHLYGFLREFENNESICENIFFEKLHELRGYPINIYTSCPSPPCPGIHINIECSPRKRWRCIHYAETMNLIREFISYANATVKLVSYKPSKNIKIPINGISTDFIALKGIRFKKYDYTYPYSILCRFIITQFRGYKSQLRKIYDIIDIYSWIAVCIVLLITLLFFKYFLAQPFIIGLMNLCRLCSNFGLTTSITNIRSRMYFACVLFFIITIQGILTGNLAALLSHDIPNRQVNSIQDLADLNYMIYAAEVDFDRFQDPIFKGRMLQHFQHESCLPFVKNNYSIAWYTWGAGRKADALKSNLHVSDCVRLDYATTMYSKKLKLGKKLNKLLNMKISGDTKFDLAMLVAKEIQEDTDSMEIIFDPVILTIRDLGFAFAILGIGWGCAFISFIAEVILHRLNRRVTLTRVIVLK